MATIREDDDQDNEAAVQPTHGAEVEVEDDKVQTPKDEVEVIEDDGADERTASSNDEDADDEKPQRHRETAAERRARAKLAKERDKKELDFQRRVIAQQDARLKQLEQGQIVTRVTELDSRISTALNEVETFDKIKAAAITKANGADVVAADNLRNQAAQRANEAIAERQRVIEAAQRPVAKEPAYADKAREFMAANPWYNHNGSDEDSKLVKQIDAEVAKEYVPTSDAYWKELQRRVAKHLPEKFAEEDDAQDQDDTQQVTQVTPRRKGPPVGGTSRSNSSTVTQVRLSPERVAAMKEAGAWDDPVLRTRMAKAYANYDKQNKSRG
jgi:hypothetical protein